MPTRTVLLAHKFHITTDEDLVDFLRAASGATVLHIWHSFSDAPDRRSFFRLHVDGRLARQGRTADYRWLPEPLLYLKELLCSAWWVVRFGGQWDHLIALDGLCTLFGLLLRAGGCVRRVTFWSIDLVPAGRFARRWKDILYRGINRLAAVRADEVWDLTELMVEEKARTLGLRPADYRSHRVVPIGVWINRIRRFPYAECDRHTLVFMGHLLAKQGAQLVVQSIPRIIEQIPDFCFKVIGSGSFEPDLRQQVAELGVERHVRFLGHVEDDEQMEREVARCGAAVAPYARALDTFTQFGADPGKIKTYLGCGVPVLVTDVPWISAEIGRRRCGLVVSEQPREMADAVVRLLTDATLNQELRDNAAKFAAQFDFGRVFGGLGLDDRPPRPIHEGQEA